MDMQTLSHFAHIQTKGAAYSTFHLCPSVPVRHTNLFYGRRCTNIDRVQYSSYLMGDPSFMHVFVCYFCVFFFPLAPVHWSKYTTENATQKSLLKLDIIKNSTRSKSCEDWYELAPISSFF